MLQNISYEEAGISKERVDAFTNGLIRKQVNMHGFILLSDGKIFAEKYFAPYNRESVHRMYSAGKSMVSVAIGLLCEEGKLSLSDNICSYFEDKLPDMLHPYIKAIKIEDMLKMATAHKSTTYKRYRGDWVESFFCVEPTHYPNTIFNYDTSATHVLSALIERLSGKTLLEYLKERVLDYVGVSDKMRFLTDPSGVSQGGSGLLCTLRDLAAFAAVCCNNGEWNGRQLIPRAYLEKATSKQIDTTMQPVIDEQQGYGYHFWKAREEGFCCYGMGGQLALCFPKKKLALVTMADTQANPAALTQLYDTFYDEIYAAKETGKRKEKAELSIKPLFSELKIIPVIDKTYIFNDNVMGITKVTLHTQREHGSLIYETSGGSHTIPFGFGKQETHLFPKTEYQCISSGAFMDERTLIIKTEIIDNCNAEVMFEFGFSGRHVVLKCKRVKEEFIMQFDGIADGMETEN